MKDIRIDNKMQRVFILTESPERIVYIPVKHLHRIDYDRLKEIEAKYSKNLLDGLAKTTLDNGRNALVQYDGIIQVMQKTGSSRIRKPDEGIFEELKTEKETRSIDATPTKTAEPTQAKAEVEEEKPARRKPGPKPKPKAE